MNRSAMMSRVKATDTAPELIVRKFLHRLGFRFRLHQKLLPGKPDIVLKKYKTVIFVNGCFWHSHSCKKGMRKSKSNIAFWEDKITKNIMRDERNRTELTTQGWRVIVVWECQTLKREILTAILSELLQSRNATV